MKRLIFILIFLLALIGGTVYANIWWQGANKPVSTGENYQNFVIPRGSSAITIGNKLEEEGLIRSSLSFKIFSQVTGKSKRIQAGEYRVSPHLSLAEVVDLLTKGPVEVWVTVPEGLRREQVAERFISGLGKSGEMEEVFREEFLSESTGLEGYLFPDTYLFPKTASASAVVARLETTFDRRIADFEEDIENSDLTLDEMVTLASIIERESRNDAERPVVAGILLNRLDIGMGLQADATVQYAVASRDCLGETDCDWWKTVTGQDLEIDSPYNTYEYSGLPPAPIASPGLSSLRAVVYPEGSDYLYYIHDPEGEIHYAETLDEHNDNVRRYLRN